MTELQNELLKDSVIEKDYIIMDGQTYYINASIYDDCYNEGNFIGTFVMKRLEFEYAETVDFKQKEFKFYKSFKVGDGWQSIDYGTFIVQSVEQSDTGETVKVTAYDYALKFAQPYETELDYSSGNITLWQVFEEILGKLQITTDLESFTNSDFIVDSNQFVEGYSYGNVMAQIAGISGNFAHIYKDKLCLIFTNNTGIVIEKGQYSEFEDKRDAHPITIVVIEDGVVEGENIVRRWEEGIELYGENYFKITGNLFAYTQAKRQQLIDALFEKIKGFYYSSMKLTNCLFPELKCGDKVQIRAKDGTLVDSIVLRWQNSDYSHTLEAPSIIKATVKYETPRTAEQIARRTEIRVDKQENEVKALSSNVETIEKELVLNKTTEEGKEFYLTDSADSNCKSVEIFGESIQDGTPTPDTPVEIESVSGKNEFDINGTIYNGNDTTHTVDGTILNVSGTNWCGQRIEVQPNTDYVISAKTHTGRILIFDKPIAYSIETFDIAETSQVFNTGNNDAINILFYSGGTEATFEDIQLEKGSEPTFYVPYNHIGFKSVGNNKFKAQGLSTPSSNTDFWNVAPNSTIYTQKENGWANLRQSNLTTSNTYYNIAMKSGALDLKPNTQYTYIVEFANVTKNNNTDIISRLALVQDGGGVFTYSKSIPLRQIESGVTLKYLFTTINDLSSVSLFYSYLNLYNNSIDFDVRFTIVEGDYTNTDIDYEPYKESITTIPLLHDMRSLPNGTRDTIYYKDGKWYDEQRVGQKILTGNENISIYTYNGTNGIQVTDFFNENLMRASGMCNYSSKVGQYYSSNAIWCGVNTKHMFWIAILDLLGLSTVAEFKTWLSSHNVEIIYELAKPIITEITDPEMINALENIRTFKNITHITADAPSMLTYYTNSTIVQEMVTKSEFTITNEQINAEVRKKVGENEIIAKINLSAEEAQIDADKVSLKRKNNRLDI